MDNKSINAYIPTFWACFITQKMMDKKEPITMSDIRTQALMFTQQLSYLPKVSEFIEKVKHLKNLNKFAAIIHDKDTDKNGEPVKPHLHVMMEFSARIRPSSIAKQLKQKAQYFEVMSKRGQSLKYSVNNGFAYLIHETYQAKKAKKYQYPMNNVVANFDYPNFITEIQEQIKNSPKNILNDLNKGNINKYEAITRLRACGGLAVQRYLSAIDKIIEAQNIIKQEKWIRNKEKKHEPIKIIWIFGPAGVGKTEFAKHIASKTSNDGTFDFTGSTKDLFQNTGTAPSLIIDEIRPKDLKFNDLLKITDPFNYRKYAPSRYHDKAIIADTIIFTSPYSPIQFFSKYKLDNNDSFKQLQRRITITIEVTDKQIIQLTPQIQPTIKLTTEELLNAIALNQTYSITYTDQAISKNTFIKPQSQKSSLTLSDLL